jgi:hypothetical protein
MSRPRKTSPTLEITIGKEQRERAIKSNSGGCLIADAIKSQYPHLSRIEVDMATIRATDRERGERYIYLTPPAGQHLLLAFDQGWPQPVEQLTIRTAVKIMPVTRPKSGAKSAAATAARREVHVAELRAKQAAGEPLTKGEKASLTRMTDPSPAPERPASTGPVEVIETREGLTIRGGARMVQGKSHPNLLRGRNRHFGAKLADPGQAFNEAVDAAVAERMQDAEKAEP